MAFTSCLFIKSLCTSRLASTVWTNIILNSVFCYFPSSPMGSVPAHVYCSRLRTIRVFQLQPEQRGLSFTCSYLFGGNAPFEEIVTVCNLPPAMLFLFACWFVFFFSFVCIHLMFYWKWRYGSAHCTCRLVNQRLQEFHWFLQF